MVLPKLYKLSFLCDFELKPLSALDYHWPYSVSANNRFVGH